MRRETFRVSNLTCGGCEASIIYSLFEIRGVMKVEVNHDLQSIIVDCNENASRNQIGNTLNILGFPEIQQRTTIH